MVGCEGWRGEHLGLLLGGLEKRGGCGICQGLTYKEKRQGV